MTNSLNFLFWCHDTASALLVRYLFTLKKIILIGAHLSFLGLFFPELRQDFGSVALSVLLFLLFLSPASKLFHMKLLYQLMGLRREMGILMGYLATVHVVGFLIDPDWFDFIITPYWPNDLLSMDARYQVGLLAYFLTLPLLVTSNAWANRVLGGKNWKRLHRLVYPLLLLALFHKFLRGGAVPVQDIIMPTFIFMVYVVAKVLAEKNFLPPLERVIRFIAGRYQQYRVNMVAHEPPV
ncbi:MAG: ferric reductase-like transmembrane domain-containing protein [Candidatus Moranbacteria bacterium]|nr:ferric reductase-like transmembrane domain-containing protein [Candidatus Moranbacteria bacterium]